MLILDQGGRMQGGMMQQIDRILITVLDDSYSVLDNSYLFARVIYYMQKLYIKRKSDCMQLTRSSLNISHFLSDV